MTDLWLEISIAVTGFTTLAPQGNCVSSQVLQGGELYDLSCATRLYLAR
jgi:hypothetical protein